MLHQDGERCSHLNPSPRFMVMLNNDRSRLLTDTAPRWGNSDDNVSRYAFYGVELGNFDGLKSGDRFRITLLCEETGTYGMVENQVGNITDASGERYDVTFSEMEMIPPPQNLRKDVWGSGTEIRLYWDKMDATVTYNVYRRDYRKSGVYELVAEKVTHPFYTDKNITGDQIYGYIVSAVDSQGQMGMVSEEITNIAGSDFLTDVKYPDQIKNDGRDLARVIAGEKRIVLEPNNPFSMRLIRGVGRDPHDLKNVLHKARLLLNENLDGYVKANESLYSRIPIPTFDNREEELLYWSAFSLLRQVMLPPEGKSSFNYYVFSREPTWGWGHGGQVFHESLSMLAYAHMAPVSAMNSQRVYLDRQQENGYINYRTGSYLDETIETNGEWTSSAPWYAWQNWEVYRITKDKAFLKEMYISSKQFYDYYVSNRDKDGDGLCEWGAHAVLESVRDDKVTRAEYPTLARQSLRPGQGFSGQGSGFRTWTST